MKKWILTLILIAFVSLIFISCSDDKVTEPINIVPTCFIASPSADTIFNESENIIINVESNDEDGTIAQIRFYIDSLGIGSDISFPYSIIYSTDSLSLGSHLLKITAKDNDGSEISDSLNFGIAPKAPTELTAIQNNVYTFSLNWTDNSNGEDGFKIERKIDDGSYTVIATETGTSYVDNTVSKGYGTVFYQVRAYKGTDYYSTYASTNSAVTFPTPTNLTATQTSITSASLNWIDNSIGEEKFEVERKLSTESTFIKVAEVIGSDTATKSWDDAMIIPNLTYDYRVRAIKGVNSSTYISKTYANIFLSPSGLSATQNNVYTFTLGWIDNSNGEDGFKIERKIDDGSFTVIATVTGTNYVDDTVSKGYGTVYYQVRGYKGTDYYSTYASTNSAVTFPAPTNFMFSKINISTIKLDWTDNSSGEEGFIIDKKIGTEEWIVGYGTVVSNVTTWSDNNSEINQMLVYRISAYKALNLSATLTTSNIDNTFPAPSNLLVTQSTISSATLQWYDNSIGEDKFEIERKLSTEATYIKIGEVVGNDVTTKSWQDTNLTYDLTYDYRVKALKGINSSDFTSITFNNVINAPSFLIATVDSDTSIKLTWTDNSTYEDGFVIDRKVGSDGVWEIGNISIGANITTWTDDGLSTGTMYFYRVRAYYQTNNSDYSNEVFTSTIDLTRFVSVPIGSFSMGEVDVATPIHTVNITRSYYIGKYEVTQKEWGKYMPTTTYDYGAGDNYPVYYISWYELPVYCNFRSMNEGLSPCYAINGSTDPSDWGTIPTSWNNTWNAITCDFTAKGYRLLTEAEWEYAARYNDGRVYPWGNAFPFVNSCNYDFHVGATSIVGSFPLGNSNLGLCDIAGNVWEWLWDWKSDYSSEEQTDPSGPETIKAYRILRGGSWGNHYDLIKCTYRISLSPNTFSKAYGFRVARTK